MFVYLKLLNSFLVVSLELTDLKHALVPGPALLPPLKVLQPDKAQGTIHSDFIELTITT